MENGSSGQELLKKLLRNSGEGGDERERWRTARTERILKSIENPWRKGGREGERRRKNRLQMMLQRL